jgi:hypothetical protein
MRPAADPPAGSAAAGRAAVRAEIDQIRRDFRRLVTQASATDLRLPSAGTKWSNQQLLFHMLFGYLIVRGLLLLARFLGRRPRRASVALACLLNCARRPFHLINYLGSCAGARIIHRPGCRACSTASPARCGAACSRRPTVTSAAAMHYPTTWDPFFAEYMTVAELYRYPHAALPPPPPAAHPARGGTQTATAARTMTNGGRS